MWNAMCPILFGISCVAFMQQHAFAADIPTPVQLGSAIIAAVEDDVEQEEQARQQLAMEQNELLTLLSKVDDLDTLEQTLTEIQQGRGKYRRKQKMLKYLYPLIVGVLIAKIVLIPLLLKMITAISASSFVMSKIALATTGFLALKWILGGSTKERTHLEIVHLPVVKPYQSNAGYAWDDMSWSGSNFIDSKTKQPLLQRSKYIPVAGGKDAASSITNFVAAGAGSGYHYPHYSNDNVFDGKPFL